MGKSVSTGELPNEERGEETRWVTNIGEFPLRNGHDVVVILVGGLISSSSFYLFFFVEEKLFRQRIIIIINKEWREGQVSYETRCTWEATGFLCDFRVQGWCVHALKDYIM